MLKEKKYSFINVFDKSRSNDQRYIDLRNSLKILKKETKMKRQQIPEISLDKKKKITIIESSDDPDIKNRDKCDDLGAGGAERQGLKYNSESSRSRGNAI